MMSESKAPTYYHAFADSEWGLCDEFLVLREIALCFFMSFVRKGPNRRDIF